ncbi:hypothetical protein vseg_000021 [Gypsophila vaccaria]
MASEVSGRVEAGSSETTIEIKIKTMDSQTYTLQVDKQMPVPALKECIASVTGVMTDRQRLICRGKVLRDDQLLSAYHVEDGHTLHLVAREPAASSSSSEAPPGDSAFDRQIFQVAPGIVVELETFSMPRQGDRGPSDFSRFVSAALGSAITNTGGSAETREHAGDNRSQAVPTHGSAAATTQISPEQSGIGNSNVLFSPDVFGIPAGGSFATVQAPVIPDALDTLSQYMSRMRQEFLNSGNVEGNNNGASSILGNEGAFSYSARSENALPTPASLAELLSTTSQMLNQIAGESLPQLARQLENHGALTDSVDRANVQAGASRSGILLQNLGAYFLELGRTVMTLRLGRSPSEAVVNAGPAVYVSSSGPNPLMVQPLPFNPGSRFGIPFSGNLQSELGLTNGIGASFVPRRMDIQIRRVPLSTHQTEPVGPQQSSGQRVSSPVIIGVTQSVQTATGTSDSSSLNGGDGARGLPFSTMMAAPPNTNHSPPEAGSLGFLYSLLGRHPNLASGNQSSGTGSQVPGNMQTPESTTAFELNGDAAEAGRAASFSSGPRVSASSHTINIDILSSGGIPTDQNAEAPVPPGILRILRGLFPGGEIQVERATSEGIATEGTEQAPPSGTIAEEEEPRVTIEGLFFSAMLQQLMPLITQHPEIERAVHAGEGASSMQTDDPTSSSPVENSEDRTSRHRDDVDPAIPNSKRQKIE